jgi:hypothetical protein
MDPGMNYSRIHQNSYSTGKAKEKKLKKQKRGESTACVAFKVRVHSGNRNEFMKKYNRGHKFNAFSVGILILLLFSTLWGCAHTYVSLLGGWTSYEDTWDLSRASQYTGIWKNTQKEEIWYLYDDGLENGFMTAIIQDEDGNTGDFICRIISCCNGNEVALITALTDSFIDRALTDSFIDRALTFLYFSDDQPTVQPVFTIYHIDRKNNELMLLELRPAWVRKMAKNTPGKIRFLEVEDTLLITSEPADLIQLLESQDDLHTAFRKFRVLKYAGQVPRED